MTSAGVARSTSPASGQTRRSSDVVSAITLRSVRANTVARDTSSWERSAILILSAACPGTTPEAAALPSDEPPACPQGGSAYTIGDGAAAQSTGEAPSVASTVYVRERR